jgi:hypothetical protein
MALTPLEILNGTFSLIFVIVSLIVGLFIASRYLQIKNRTLLLVGITWIGLTTPWLPSTISFIVYLITSTGLTPIMYFTIGNIASPLILVIWILAFTDLRFKNRQKLLVIIYSIIGIAYEVYLVYFLVVDPNIIGDLTGIFDVTYKGIVLLFAMFIVINVLVTGVLFGQQSLRSKDSTIRLKGKFLIIAFISWGIGAIMDAALPLNIFTLTIARVILISSAIEFYIGFILPRFIKDLFIKE